MMIAMAMMRLIVLSTPVWSAALERRFGNIERVIAPSQMTAQNMSSPSGIARSFRLSTSLLRANRLKRMMMTCSGPVAISGFTF